MQIVNFLKSQQNAIKWQTLPDSIAFEWTLAIRAAQTNNKIVIFMSKLYSCFYFYYSMFSPTADNLLLIASRWLNVHIYSQQKSQKFLSKLFQTLIQFPNPKIIQRQREWA